MKVEFGARPHVLIVGVKAFRLGRGVRGRGLPALQVAPAGDASGAERIWIGVDFKSLSGAEHRRALAIRATLHALALEIGSGS